MLVAGHVVAYEDLGGRRRGELEVGEETRHFLQAIERGAGPLGEFSQFRVGQKAMPVLDLVQFLDDHAGDPFTAEEMPPWLIEHTRGEIDTEL